MNVLFIEPDQVLGGAAKTAMERAGMQVYWRRNAQTAIDALDQQTPDVIVLELQLGLHNGIELLYELRSYHEWQNIPVVVHTINHKASDHMFAKAFEELGVAAVLYKPQTSTEKLLQAVQACVVHA